MVCYMKCDPLHHPTKGFRAQCSLSDGKWFEKAIGTCTFEHHCYWPQAGPMGCYHCHDNLIDLGYHTVGHSIRPTMKNHGNDHHHHETHYHGHGHGHGHYHRSNNGTKQEVNLDDIEEVAEDEVVFRKRRDDRHGGYSHGHNHNYGHHHHSSHAHSSIVHTQTVTKVTEVVKETVKVGVKKAHR